MNDTAYDANTVYLDLDRLTEAEIDEVAAAADALGAGLEELPVTQNAEEVLRAAPVVMAVLTPFLKMGAEVAADRLKTFLKRALAKPGPQRVYLPDVDVHLLWDDVAKDHTAEAAQAVRLLEPGAFEPGSVLVFDPSTRRWQPQG